MSRFERIMELTSNHPTASYSGLFTGARPPVLHPARTARMLIDRAFVGSIVMGRVASTGHDVPVLEDRYVSVIMPTSGQIRTEFRGSENVARPGDVLMVSRGARTTRVQGQGSRDFQALVLMIDQDSLTQAIRHDDRCGKVGLQGGDFLIVLKGARHRDASQLISLARVLAEDLGSDIPEASGIDTQRGWQAILSEKLATILRKTGHMSFRDDTSQRGREQHVRLAMDFMRSSYADIKTIAEVAEASGIAVRTLEASFREILDKSPLQVLTEWRMEEARRALLAADETASVTQIALGCGFSHVGRFATAYRKRFGELPSATLRAKRF